jgi:hypothetical protein
MISLPVCMSIIQIPFSKLIIINIFSSHFNIRRNNRNIHPERLVIYRIDGNRQLNTPKIFYIRYVNRNYVKTQAADQPAKR